MRRLKETISKVLVGIASLLSAGILLLIIAGCVQMFSLGMDWMFNHDATPTFIDTFLYTGVGVGFGALAGEFREMIRD